MSGLVLTLLCVSVIEIFQGGPREAGADRPEPPHRLAGGPRAGGDVAAADRRGAARPVRSGEIEGAAILSTCNRTEIYLSPLQHHEEDELRRIYCRLTGLPPRRPGPPTSCATTRPCATWSAWRRGSTARCWARSRSSASSRRPTRALAAGATNSILNKALLRAIEAGKDVRHRTGISQGAVSVASAAVQMAQRIFGSLAGRRVLLVGAGETARLAANHLAGAGVADWRIANRTEANARGGGRPAGRPRHEFPPTAADLEWADLVVSATGADGLVIGGDEVRPRSAGASGRCCCWTSPCPRDIDPSWRSRATSTSTPWTTSTSWWPPTWRRARRRPGGPSRSSRSTSPISRLVPREPGGAHHPAAPRGARGAAPPRGRAQPAALPARGPRAARALLAGVDPQGGGV
jgi:hypothetical protein